MVGTTHRDLAAQQRDHALALRKRARQRRAVDVADRDRERVGGVVLARLLLEREQRRDHPRDLLLVGAPAAAYRALDLLRGVARTRQSALAGGEHHDAARVTDGECRAHVLAEVQLLERDRIGLVRGDQLLDLVVDVRQSPLARQRGRRLDHTAVERHEPAVAASDHAVAGVGEPGIDAEDDHVP